MHGSLTDSVVIPSQPHSHTVNLLTALPLQCLDVLLSVPLTPDSEQSQGVNMDCVHTLLLFMEHRLESVRMIAIWDPSLRITEPLFYRIKGVFFPFSSPGG